MAKNFGQLRVNDIIYISNGYHPFGIKGISFDNCVATVTNIDIHGDFMVVSYKSPHFNHTVEVHKNRTEDFVYVKYTHYRNYKREFKFVYKISISI